MGYWIVLLGVYLPLLDYFLLLDPPKLGLVDGIFCFLLFVGNVVLFVPYWYLCLFYHVIF